jgi:hypothetical protein
MAESRGVGWLARDRVSSCGVGRPRARGGVQLARRWSARVGVDEVRLVGGARPWLSRLIGWSGDGPMGPSPRVMNSICVC